MRRICICIVLFTSFVHYSDAKDIDKKTAQTVAQNFMKQGNPNFSVSVDNVYDIKDEGDIILYIVNFTGGGWAMVSVTESTVPILGFSYEGLMLESSQLAESFKFLLGLYKTQIKEAKKLTETNEEVKSKWESLMNNENSLRLKSYTPGTVLLNTDRGHVKWSQEENNDGGCSPTYNKYCPGGDADGSDCDDKKPTGCAAVAMGQIMWFWQYPNFSDYRNYNWKVMPPELVNNTDESSGDEVAMLLKDCGTAANMNYTTLFGTDFSWATTSNVKDGLRDHFGYEGVELKVRSHYPYGNVWNDLIRAEIDAGRPVIIRADKADLSGDKHMFVCDGYHSSYNDYFHFNFGWGYPGNSYNTSYLYFNDLTPGNHEYNENQQAIIGISPSIGNIASSINDVTYSSISDTKNLEAMNSISLPASGKSLYVTSSGSLNLFAGDAIILKPGFKVQSGGNFHAMISINEFSDDCGIYVEGWTGYFTDGVLRFRAHNANTYEFEAYALNGQLAFQSAGTVDEIPVVVWDGTGSIYGTYTCIITFRNNCGEILSNSYSVTSPGQKSAVIENGTITSLSEETVIIEECDFNLYPNPNDGSFSVQTNSQDAWDIAVYDMNGHQLFHRSNLCSFDTSFNLGNLASGIYHVKIRTKNKVFSEKLVVQ